MDGSVTYIGADGFEHRYVWLGNNVRPEFRCSSKSPWLTETLIDTRDLERAVGALQELLGILGPRGSWDDTSDMENRSHDDLNDRPPLTMEEVALMAGLHHD